MPQYSNSNDNDNIYEVLILRYCNHLDLNQEAIDHIRDCVEIVENKKILSKNTPNSVVCGCIYFVIIMLGLNISKSKLAEKCDISVATITKTYQILIEYTDELI